MKEIKKTDEKDLAVKTPAQAEQILEQEKEAISAPEEVSAEAPAVGQPAAGVPGGPGGGPGGRGGRKRGGNVSAASVLGEVLAAEAIKKGIKKVAFDRGGYLYHGRIKAFAEAARKAGLEF